MFKKTPNLFALEEKIKDLNTSVSFASALVRTMLQLRRRQYFTTEHVDVTSQECQTGKQTPKG